MGIQTAERPVVDERAPMSRLLVTFPSAEFERLRRFASAHDRSMAAEIRMAVRSWMAREQGTERAAS